MNAHRADGVCTQVATRGTTERISMLQTLCQWGPPQLSNFLFLPISNNNMADAKVERGRLGETVGISVCDNNIKSLQFEDHTRMLHYKIKNYLPYKFLP